MREDETARGGFRSRKPSEFLEKIGVRETVKTVPSDALRVVRRGNRQSPGDVGKISMKRSVEAGVLGDVGVPIGSAFDEGDLVGQVIRPERNQLVEFAEDGLRQQ